MNHNVETDSDLERAERTLLNGVLSGALSRRSVLKRGVALGLSAPVMAMLLAACGDSDDDEDTGEPTAPPANNETADEDTPADEGDQGPTDADEDEREADSTESDAGSERGGGGDLRILWWQAPVLANGHLTVAGASMGAITICMEPLAHYNADLELVPILAAEIPTLENGGLAADRTSVTWKLREGVKWHDGEDFNAEDVVFTFEYLSDPETNATTRAFYDDIESVEAIDEYTVRLNFGEPIAAWFNKFIGNSGTILPEHLLRDYVGANAAEAPFNLLPVGTGPYKMVEFRPGDLALYEINEDYWDPGKPYFDRVELKGGGDTASAARAVLQTGEYDWSWNLQVETSVLQSLADGGTGQIVTWPGAGTEKLLLNHSDPQTELDGQFSHRDVPHPHFQELAVRQAVALAIPRDIIAEQLYGESGVATGYTLNESPDYMPEGITWEYNLDKANELLDEVGAERGSGGIREFNGREMRWVCSASINSLRQREQEVIKESFAALGIDMEIAAIEASVYFDASNVDSFQHLYYDFGIERNAGSIYPLLWYLRYLSIDPLTHIAQKENGWSGRNHQRYQNEEFNDLWEQASNEADEALYIPIFHKMQHHVVDNVADIGMVSCNSVSAASNSLTGYEPTPYSNELWDIRNWRRKE